MTKVFDGEFEVVDGVGVGGFDDAIETYHADCSSDSCSFAVVAGTSCEEYLSALDAIDSFLLDCAY